MIETALEIDRLINKGKPRKAAAGLVVSRLKKQGIAINENDAAQTLLRWRHELTKAGRGQGLGRTNGDWRWFGSVYLLGRDQLLGQVKRDPQR